MCSSIMSLEEFQEIQDECYICFEPCKNKSPCNCERFVHEKCLADWRQHSENDHCTECLEKYPIKKKRLHYFLYLILMYLIAGFLGQFFYEIASNKTVSFFVPWSEEFFLSAFCVLMLSILVYAIVWRYRAVHRVVIRDTI